ncbi:MAG: type VII secretion protein EccCa [Mycobacteriales bacterium]
MFLFSSLAMVGGSVLRGRSSTKSNADTERRDYLRYLQSSRREVREVAAAQRAAALWCSPEPDALTGAAESPRLWERRPADPDFGVVRIGRGPQLLATRLVPPESGPFEDVDPLCATALRRFLNAHSVVPDLPVALSLRRFAAVGLGGAPEVRRTLARSIIAALATWHAPADLRVLACVGDPDGEDWSWLKWLPHAQDSDEVDHVGPVRLMHRNLGTLEEMVSTELSRRPRFNRSAEPDPELPQVVVLLDGGSVDGSQLLLEPDGLQAVTVIDLDGIARELVAAHGIELGLDERTMTVRLGERTDPLGVPDMLSCAGAEALARQLAGVRIDAAVGQGEDLSTVDQTLPGLLGIADPGELDLATLCKPRPVRDRLRIPLGVAADGSVLDLDLKEAAQDGMGPHGLVVGATGSGKSELLRTLVLGLTATHSSEMLNLVLVDFKGGATFAGMADLPHVAAVITNLEDELTLVDRMQEALSGEMNRRQEILRAAGNVVSVRDYERARARGAALEPLPSLVVVVDEFSELLAQKPEFVDLFVQIGRLGRSLGLHLLLASQRLEEGRLRGLESHLSYRIGLRTFSPQESRAVLGEPDAYELPSAPGHGFLKSDTTSMRRFKAAYVSGRYQRRVGVSGLDVFGADVEVRPFTAAYRTPPPDLETALEALQAQALPDEFDNEAPPDGETVLSVMLDQLSDAGPPAHRVWLPPLSEPESLDRMYGDLAIRGGRGLCADPNRPPLVAPVGVVDRPFHQRRDALNVDLAGSGGHVAVVGGPRSGKSTLLRTLLTSLALRHTPEEVQFYGLDFSGGGLFSLAGLPHVGGLAGRQDGEVVRRVVAEVSRVVEDREVRFRERGIDTMATYRQRRASGKINDDPYGDVFLVVDGIGVLRQDYEELEAALVQLAGRALTYGVHIVVAGNRWLEFRLGLRDLMGTKLELKLGDALDSEIDRRAAETVPADRPGRGLTSNQLHYMAAVPRIDGLTSASDLGPASSNLVDRIAGAWRGRPAPKVRLLPTLIEFDRLPQPTRPDYLCIGLEGNNLAPVELRPNADTGMIVLGDSECGKTSFLRTIARQVVTKMPPPTAKVVLFDYRRTMLGEIDEEALLGYAASPEQADDVVAGLVEGFRHRLPGSGVTPEQLRAKSWWSGPEIYVLVDDYDLVASSGGNPLIPLLDLLSQARDIGLHLFIARRGGGAGRALMDPVLGRARELGLPGIVMSAPRDEGILLGVRPAPAAPGRGTLVDRRYGTVPVQLARLDSPHLAEMPTR